jgi:protein involved in polysaccharide export with SLBB domain
MLTISRRFFLPLAILCLTSYGLNAQTLFRSSTSENESDSSDSPAAGQPMTAEGPSEKADDEATQPIDLMTGLTKQVISSGDVVRMMMIEDPDVKYEGPVSGSGTINVPYFGDFRIAGMSEKEAGKKLSEALTENLYKNATISVVLVQRGPSNVYVYGAVGKPGAYPIPTFGQFTILRLMLVCGGLSGWADPKNTFVLRYSADSQKVERLTVDLSEIFARAIPYSDRDLALQDGDIVCIPGLNGELFQFMMMEDREVIVIGEVRNPGPVTFSAGEPRTVMRAIFKVGGFSQFAKKDKVRIFRYEDNGERTERIVNAEEIVDEGLLHKDVDLKPGDVLIVPQKRINM